MNLWTNLWRTVAEQWTFEPLSAQQVPDRLEHVPIRPETGYLSVFLRSMRIVNVRRGLTRFYPAVHSFIVLTHRSGSKAEFQVLASPSRLQALDAENVDRVISLNHRLLGPVPYRGGDVEVEIGLFSVKSADLAGPFLSVLEMMASAAGVSFITTALPFVEPLRKGIELLVRSDDESILEIGLYKVFNKPETGSFFVMRAPRGVIDPAGITAGEDYRLLDSSGENLANYPYAVFSFESSPERDDWFLIPDIAAAYSELQVTVRGGVIEEAEKAFTIFKRTALTSPDLLLADARRLVAKIEAEVRSVMQPSLTAYTASELPELRAIDLYGNLAQTS